MSITDAKAAARAAARARLAALTPDARAAAAARVARAVWTLPEMSAARTLLLFAALPGEVATAEIAAEAARRGITVTYPRCLPETRGLALHHVTDAAHLRAGAYGIAEPDADLCPIVPLEEIDVALVPGLAWDRAGTRLGRGAGYYDRCFALPRWRALRCGLFFAAQEAQQRLPAGPWDAPLEAVITEREVWRRA